MSRVALAAACVAVAACGGPSTALPAAGAVAVQLGPGGDAGENDAAACGVQSRFAIPQGALSYYVPTTIDDGARDEAGVAHVRCRVHPDGGAYDVDLSLTRDDGSGAAITGTMSRTSSQAQGSITPGGGGSTFAAQGPCTIDFTAVEGMDIQPGRVWAVITCPRASDGAGHICQASAEILFESCQQ